MALVTVQRSPTPSTTSSPCVSESGSGEDDRRSQPRSISESFLTVKGAALFLPRGNSPTPSSAPCISQRRNKHTGDLQKHLQTMFTVLRPEDTIRLAVRLESAYPQVTRYMVVVSTNGRQDTEESIVLGMDFVSSDSCCTVGLVLPLWSDTLIHLDGDGGFSVSTVNRVHVFKPVSVQAMWSALQSLHKACEVARCHNHYPGSLFLTWVSYYQSRVSSNQFCINEWNAMQDVESHRANSPVLFTDLPTERERTERLIKMRLREIMMQKDLENVTCKEIRTELEMQMVCNLREFKEFIDNEMIVILGQMDSPTEIFEHVYLGSEWNASNLDELQNSGVRYILNVTREIDNFFPGMFEYHNIRVYDEEATNLLEYWNETYKFITKAKKAGAKCLVHCKMGVSRSASTVIAYAMKEYGWDLDTAFDYVKERRAVTKPNPSFMKQLEEYQGILLASKQRHNKLWRSHSDSDLSAPSDSMCKASSPSLGRSDSHNNNTTSSSSSSSSPSLHHFLGVAVLQALGAAPKDSAEPRDTHASDSHALSNGVGGPQAEEEVRSDREEPAPPLFPAPRAATLVPEEPLDNAATVPVAMPHLPPSLHMVLPTPELPGGHGAPPSQLDVSARSCKPEELSLHLPERSSSEEVSPLTLGSSDSDIINRSLSDSVSNEPLSPAPSIPLTLPLAASDDNNNPSEFQSGCTLDSRGEADGSSSHSADSIDFFSAREKFLGLAQDGRTRTLSEQQRTPGSADRDSEASEEEEEEEQEEEQEEQADEASPQSEDGPDPSHHCHHDNGVSVRHIVTEIEAICHPASSPPTPSSSLPSSSSSAPLLHPGHPEEGEVVQSSSAPPSHPPSPPSTLPSGSVRRATKQLEEKLKQELELSVSPRSPLHSPSTEHPPTRLSPSTPGTAPQHAAEQDITQEENQDVSVQTESKEKRTGSRTEHHTLDSSGTDHAPDPPGTPDSNISQVSGAGPLTVHSFPGSHSKMPHAAPCGPSVESSSDTSDRSQNSQCQTPQDSTRQLTVDGVTVQESDTDHCKSQVSCGPGCEAQLRLAHGGQELERIQQTLRELQAFLHEGAPLQAPDLGRPLALRDAMDTEQGQCKGASCEPSPPGGRQEGRSFLEQARWHRAVELEARIRQAGLTPPSLMKRSASLAKLDCLELSANDLSGLDLRPYNRTTSSLSSSSLSQDSWSLSPSHPDDFWKKQKVLALGHCVQETDLSCKDSSHSPRRPQEDSGEREEPDGSGGAVPSWRPQGRGYSARRSRKAPAEKKQRAFTVLYNTM